MRMANGYVSKVGRDGLIVFRPKRRKRPVPVRGLMLLVVGVLCFKGLIMAQYGNAIYDARVADLRTGTTVEQVGALIMQADPISQFIAERAAPLFR
ncbi:hypothetical protein D6850_12150 [Roseovarius spongiae]|uniref:Uncharacterized protein n=1 Tax=Roseovarius spongiae TaxID=2320272 RepID=A0A3A8AWZ3_9RHOB|nr:hypothetical protein D6850_12150 [Roseovarius spongiae]